jgi:Secretion system C-terminal sorting domain
MKKTLLLFLLFTGIVNAQIINIPDANFKAKLLSSNTTNGFVRDSSNFAIKLDSNSNNEIEVSEALNVGSLIVSGSNISSLSGISSFTNLTALACQNNNLTSEDLSNLTQLKAIQIQSNQLVSLNIQGLTNLIQIFCSNNLLSNLDLNGLNKLELINVSSNQLTSLNVNGFDDLRAIDFSNNLLSTIDLGGLKKIQFMTCNNNNITKLDISEQVVLNSFECNNNIPLEQLFLKNGKNNINVNTSFSGNPNLKYICVDESEKIAVKNLANTYGYINCVVNSYCTFTPGGSYNTITGNVRFDSNNDGCSVADGLVNNFRIDTQLYPDSGLIKGATFTNNTGNYKFYTEVQDMRLTPFLENETYFNIDPETSLISGSATQDFCITANGIHNDLEIVLAPVVNSRPGFDSSYQIVYKNKGNQTLSGDFTLTYNDAIIDFVSASTAINNQTTGLLTWNYTNLLPFETRTIDLILNVNSAIETPAVNVGDILNFTATINPIVGDDLPNDNVFNYKQTVMNTLDTNFITCLEGNDVDLSKISDYLHYKINFENIGTEIVDNVVVEMEFNPAKFDIGSLKILYSPNEVIVTIKENKIIFFFSNIDLKIPVGNPKSGGGTGGVLMAVIPNPNVPPNVPVGANASIFFDYNAPITTNIASTQFTNFSLKNPNHTIDSSITIYPNPTKNNIKINANTVLKSIQLFDIQGRILQIKNQDKNATSLDISNRSKGIYFLKITTEKGSKIEKIIKD